jgi:hypothetical protein
VDHAEYVGEKVVSGKLFEKNSKKLIGGLDRVQLIRYITVTPLPAPGGVTRFQPSSTGSRVLFFHKPRHNDTLREYSIVI